MRDIPVNALDAATFSPYGWVLGEPFSQTADVPKFSNPATDFWQAHVFDAGAGGEPEILWVNYRSTDSLITHLEKHLVTQQAIVPLSGDIVHIVANSNEDGSPDPSTVAAFSISPGQGVCMRPDCWHATRVRDAEVSCLMLTRRSTTVDLIKHLTSAVAATESAIVEVSPFHIVME